MRDLYESNEKPKFTLAINKSGVGFPETEDHVAAWAMDLDEQDQINIKEHEINVILPQAGQLLKEQLPEQWHTMPSSRHGLQPNNMTASTAQNDTAAS